MSDDQPSNVVSLNTYKQELEDQKNLELLHPFVLVISGQHDFDSLDALIEDLQNEGLVVEAFIVEGKKDNPDKTTAAND